MHMHTYVHTHTHTHTSHTRVHTHTHTCTCMLYVHRYTHNTVMKAYNIIYNKVYMYKHSVSVVRLYTLTNITNKYISLASQTLLLYPKEGLV